MPAASQTIPPPSKALLLFEGRAIHELGAFLTSLPLLSLARGGDGHSVMDLPGLVASDIATRPLRTFLSNQGYVVSGWGQGRNYGLRDGVTDGMIRLLGRYGPAKRTQGQPHRMEVLAVFMRASSPSSVRTTCA